MRKQLKLYELSIGGMTCQHCVMHIRKALESIDGVEVEDVQIGKARIWCDEHKVDKNLLREHVEDAGYQLLGVQ